MPHLAWGASWLSQVLCHASCHASCCSRCWEVSYRHTWRPVGYKLSEHPTVNDEDRTCTKPETLVFWLVLPRPGSFGNARQTLGKVTVGANIRVPHGQLARIPPRIPTSKGKVWGGNVEQEEMAGNYVSAGKGRRFPVWER
jgi:hypothetical protein